MAKARSGVKLRFMTRSLVFFLAFIAGCAQAEIIPLIHAHAHNDYEHTRPLFDALSHGFCSVEADIHLVDGKLLVAHNLRDTSPEKTLEAMYLEPLRKLAKGHNGKIYGSEPRFFLLIDLKSDFAKIYPVLRKVLEGYSDLVTQWKMEPEPRAGIGKWKSYSNTVTVVLTGNAQTATFPKETGRFAGIDGHLDRLPSMKPGDAVLWISENWKSFFHWNGKGAIPPEERAKLLDYVERVHGKGKLIRFWNAPENPTFWTEMARDGVDLLNTDDLAGLENFLLSHPYPGTLIDAPLLERSTQRLEQHRGRIEIAPEATPPNIQFHPEAKPPPR
jgi:hypothetical protein